MIPLPSHRQATDRLLLAAAVAALALAAALLVGAAPPGLLGLLPSLLLVVPLLLGRFPGERVIAALAARCAPRRAHPAVGRARRSLALLARGGRLVSAGLAGRAPPHVLPAV
ncbi:MAG TPA: hypothetical protein VMT10_03550 [Solirubrobacteraceae bacterium]|nr:hypothetical protein [Solirubrobacteraceae bacterium]